MSILWTIIIGLVAGVIATDGPLAGGLGSRGAPELLEALAQAGWVDPAAVGHAHHVLISHERVGMLRWQTEVTPSPVSAHS